MYMAFQILFQIEFILLLILADMRFMMTSGKKSITNCNAERLNFLIRFVDGTEHASCLELQCKSVVLGSDMNSSSSFS